MPSTESKSASEAAASSSKARESLSQFVAKVLDQLSLSAWLPAAALVLGGDFVLQLASVLAANSSSATALGVLGSALQRFANIKIGGALLLIVAIIVLTMVTQAFAFEAIRTLEGYWGTWRPIEWVAGLRRARFAAKRTRLDARWQELTNRAWLSARTTLETLQLELQANDPRSAVVTPNVIATTGARATGTEQPAVRLSKREREVLEALNWTDHASAELLRRRLNVDKKRRDLPRPRRALPTRLGNILRAHEDETGEADVETFVQRVFDDLPASLRAEHDEQRTRLDLYCSMVFVVASITAIAAARLGPLGYQYIVGSLLAGLALMWLMYRAALASARGGGAQVEAH
jgi:hypothetical protein